jgi:hypothetical protein
MFNFFKKKEEEAPETTDPQVNVLNSTMANSASPAPQSGATVMQQPASTNVPINLGGTTPAGTTAAPAPQPAPVPMPSSAPTPAPTPVPMPEPKPDPAPVPTPEPITTTESAKEAPLASVTTPVSPTPAAPVSTPVVEPVVAPAEKPMTEPTAVAEKPVTPVATPEVEAPVTDSPLSSVSGSGIEITPGPAEDVDVATSAVPVADTTPAAAETADASTAKTMTPPSEENSLGEDDNTPGPIEETIVSTSATKNGEMDMNDNPAIGNVGGSDDPTADAQAQPASAPMDPAQPIDPQNLATDYGDPTTLEVPPYSAPAEEQSTTTVDLSADSDAMPTPPTEEVVTTETTNAANTPSTAAPADAVVDPAAPVTPVPASVPVTEPEIPEVETAVTPEAPAAPEGADENAKLDADGTLPAEVTNPAPVADAPVEAAAKPTVDIAQLQKLTSDQLAQRPDTATAVTGDSQGNAAQVPATDEEDPLKKLLGMVKGEKGELKVKKVFVVTKTKIANEVLKLIVEESKAKGATDEGVINFILKLDEMVESGQIDESYFDAMS